MDLAALLRRWDELLIRDADSAGLWPVSETGTVLRAGAAESEIEALEQRLGVVLPPSYRTFLSLSNGGWAQAGWGVVGLDERSDDPDDERAFGFLDAARVGWFRDRDPSYVDIWGYTDYGDYDDESHAHYAFRRSIPEVEYLDHEREQDCVHSKNGHVRHALQVSADVNSDTILLNPLVVDAEGEWEAWDLTILRHAARRSRS